MKPRLLRSAGVLVAVSSVLVPLACSSASSNQDQTSTAGQANGGAIAHAGSAATTEGGTGAGGSSGGGGGVMLPPGTSSSPKTIQCGGDCTSVRAGLVYVDPCCSADNACGVDTAYLKTTGSMFTQSCEPQHQPGEPNPSCPSPAPATIDLMGTLASLDAFPGCCRPNGTCGVEVNTVTAANGLIPVAELSLGCVDAASFFPGEAAVPCTEMTGAGGAAGAGSGGAGGEP